MKVYLDNAATTPVDKRVLEAMLPYFSEKYGNPSSIYKFSEEARRAVEDARGKVAKLIGAETSEIVFTSGGTEADNLAIKGILNGKKGHIITSAIEHPAVLNVCKALEREGFEVTYIPVNKDGLVSPEDVKNAIRNDTVLITIMHANNEIGTIQPVEEIGKMARERGIVFHTDAVQTVGKIPVDVKKMNVDLLTISSHKIYGPKGVGALYVRNGVDVKPLSGGGGHEKGLRSGTENVPGIVGFGKAAELALEEMAPNYERMRRLRDRLIDAGLKIENSWLNGSREKRVPCNVNLGFKFIEGEALVLELDFNGICASTGSACSSKSLEPSHVLRAIGLPPEYCHGSLRMTLGKQNTEEEIDYVIEVLPRVVEKLREISPFKKEYDVDVQ
jgi:cysteine desulfurase